jgi:hypothetical protein
MYVWSAGRFSVFHNCTNKIQLLYTTKMYITFHFRCLTCSACGKNEKSSILEVSFISQGSIYLMINRRTWRTMLKWVSNQQDVGWRTDKSGSCYGPDIDDLSSINGNNVFTSWITINFPRTTLSWSYFSPELKNINRTGGEDERCHCQMAIKLLDD